MRATTKSVFMRLTLLLAGFLFVVTMPFQAFADAPESASGELAPEGSVVLSQQDENAGADESYAPEDITDTPDEPEPVAPIEFLSSGMYCKNTLIGPLVFDTETYPALLSEDGAGVAEIAPSKYESNGKSYIFLKAVDRGAAQADNEDVAPNDADDANNIMVSKIRYYNDEWQAYSDHWFAVEPSDVAFYYRALINITIEYVDDAGTVIDTATLPDIESGDVYDVSETVVNNMPEGYESNGEPDNPTNGIADDDIVIKVPVKKKTNEPGESGTTTPENPPAPGSGDNDEDNKPNNPAVKPNLPSLPSLPSELPNWTTSGFGDLSSLFSNFDLSSMFANMFSGMSSSMFSFGNGGGSLSWGAPSFSIEFPTSFTDDDDDDTIELEKASADDKATSGAASAKKRAPKASEGLEEARFDFAMWVALAGIAIVASVVLFVLLRKKKKQ